MCTLLTVSVLFLILGYLVSNGGQSLDWDFFTKLPLPAGETGGGMANAIVGSAEMLLLATLIGVPDRVSGAAFIWRSSAGSAFASLVGIWPIC